MNLTGINSTERPVNNKTEKNVAIGLVVLCVAALVYFIIKAEGEKYQTYEWCPRMDMYPAGYYWVDHWTALGDRFIAGAIVSTVLLTSAIGFMIHVFAKKRQMAQGIELTKTNQ